MESVKSFTKFGGVYIKAVQRLELRKENKGGGASFSTIKTPRFQARPKKKNGKDKGKSNKTTPNET